MKMRTYLYMSASHFLVFLVDFVLSSTLRICIWGELFNKGENIVGEIPSPKFSNVGRAGATSTILVPKKDLFLLRMLLLLSLKKESKNKTMSTRNNNTHRPGGGTGTGSSTSTSTSTGRTRVFSKNEDDGTIHITSCRMRQSEIKLVAEAPSGTFDRLSTEKLLNELLYMPLPGTTSTTTASGNSFFTVLKHGKYDRKIVIGNEYSSLRPFEIDNDDANILKLLVEGMTTYRHKQQQQQQQHQQGLLYLKLNYCAVNDNLVDVVSLSIKRRLLSKLKVEGYGGKIDISFIGRLITLNDKIEKLHRQNLAGSVIGTEQNKRIRHGYSLQTVVLSNKYHYGQEGTTGAEQDFFNAFKETTTIRDLRLHIIGVSRSFVSNFIQNCIATNKFLQTVSIKVKWTPELFKTLLDTVAGHPTITDLRFEPNFQGSFFFSWVGILCDFLSSPSCKIRYLSLSGQQGFGSESLDEILSSLWYGHPMKHLDVSCNRMVDFKCPTFLGLNGEATDVTISQRKLTRQLESIDFSLCGQNRYAEDVNAINEMLLYLCGLLEKCPKLRVNLTATGIDKWLPTSRMQHFVHHLLDRNLVNNVDPGDSYEKSSSDNDGTIDHDDLELFPYDSLSSGLWAVLLGKINQFPSTRRQANQIFRLLRTGSFLYAIGNDDDVKLRKRQLRHMNNKSKRSVPVTKKDKNLKQSDVRRQETTDKESVVFLPCLEIVEHPCASGRHVEIVCFVSALEEYRHDGRKVNVSSVLETSRIFVDVSKNQFASSTMLQEEFGTTDEMEVAKLILQNGQSNKKEEMERKIDDKLTEIATWLSNHCVGEVVQRKKKSKQSKQSKRGKRQQQKQQQISAEDEGKEIRYSVEQIRHALEEVQFMVHMTKPISLQYQDCIKALKPILPMVRTKNVCIIRVPYGEHWMAEAFLDDHDISWKNHSDKKNDDMADKDDGFSAAEYDDDDDDDDDDDMDEIDQNISHGPREYQLELNQREYKTVEKLIRQIPGIVLEEKSTTMSS